MAGEISSKKEKDNSNGNKIRKSRNEMIKSTLGVYLRNRNYTTADKFRRSDFILSQTPKQFVFNKMIEEDISRVNSFLYSNVLCLTNHYNTVEQHFRRFVQFVQNQPQAIKTELSDLFGPLICHIYIELIKGREWKPACDFLRNHAKLVAPIENLNAPLPSKINGCSVNSNFHENDTNNSTNVTSSSSSSSSSSSYPTATTQILFVNESTGNPTRDHFKELIRTLSTCLRFESLKTFESLVLFRSAKYEVEISLNAINALRRFLEKQGHVIILNVLHTWIHFTIIDFKDDNEEANLILLENEEENSDDLIIDKNYEKMNDIKTESLCNSNNVVIGEETNKVPTNVYLRKLTNVMKKFENLETPTKTIKIFDPERSLSNVAIDSGECHMVAAFQNSDIKLWQLNRNIQLGKNLYEKFHNRVCEWTIANESNIEDDSDNFNEKEIELFYARKYDENSFDDSGSIILRGHSRGVTDCVFSERFPLLFTTSKDCTMRIWQSKNYSCAGIYRGHNYPVWCVNESPIGSYLATGSRDYTARLWTVDREFPLITYVGHTQDVDCLAFHPNGNYLATGSCDLSVRLWSVTSGKLFRVFTECRFPIICIAFSPDGKYLAAAGEESKVRIFDLAAGSQIIELKDHTSPVNNIVWNSSGNKIASCCSDGSVRVWDITKAVNTDQQSSSPFTTNRILHYNSACSRGMKVFFNSNDTITLIGTVNNSTNSATDPNTSSNC